MSIAKYVSSRGITEILHFTTNCGLLGVLAEKALVPRAQLQESQMLEFIVKPNCDVRKDPRWVGHNSMSISEINNKFFEYSEWIHREDAEHWWCILAFSPILLEHLEVVFVTGNNIWPRAIKETGIEGLRRMFDDVVPGTYNNYIRRNGVPINRPTCVEAEVLYPGRLSIDFLTHVYFREQSHADEFLSMTHVLGLDLPDSIACVESGRFD